MASIKIVSASSCQAPPSATSSFLWDITGDQICARGADKETSRNCFRDSCQVLYQHLFTISHTLSYTISPTCSTTFMLHRVTPEGLLSRPTLGEGVFLIFLEDISSFQVPDRHRILWGDLLWRLEQPETRSVHQHHVPCPVGKK